jgi:hypothetical protein
MGDINLDNINLQDIQLCINNAERLYKDSKSVSNPTRLALIELSLEEISKGWIFYFKYIDRNPNSLDFQSFIKKPDKGDIAEIDKKHPESVKEYEKLREILDSFKNEDLKSHDLKIDFLIQLKKFFQSSYFIFTSIDYQKIHENIIRGITKKNFDSDKETNSLEEFLNQINEDNLKNLINMKNDALYVDLTPSGHIKSPDLLNSDFLMNKLEPIEIFLNFLIEDLKNTLLLLYQNENQKSH